jgi:hypothetical protein
MGLRIYRNLHRGDWTVQHNVPGKGWRKLQSMSALTVPTCEFKVYGTGRDRARCERKKNVHAFALVPWLTQSLIIDPCADDYIISYTPYDDDGFRTILNAGRKRHVDVANATAVIFGADGHIYARSINTFTPRVATSATLR